MFYAPVYMYYRDVCDNNENNYDDSDKNNCVSDSVMNKSRINICTQLSLSLKVSLDKETYRINTSVTSPSRQQRQVSETWPSRTESNVPTLASAGEN